MKAKKNLLGNCLRRSGVSLPILVITFCGQTLHADDWVGGTSNAWNEPLNWSGSAVPAVDVDASIGTIVNNIPVISATPSGTPRILIIGGGSILDHTAGSLSLTQGPGNDWRGGPVLVGWGWSSATYNIADVAGTGGEFTGFGTGSGSVTTGGWGDIRVGAGYWWDDCTSFMNINTSGTVHAAGQMYIAGRDSDEGTVNIDAGTVTLAGGWQNSMQIACITGAPTSSTGILNISGGTVTLDHRLVMAAGSTSSSRTGSGTEEDPYSDYTYVYADGSNIGTVTMTGGTLTCQTVYNTIPVDGNEDAQNWHAGVNMSSGYDGSIGGTATFNLDGGTLSTVYVFSEATTGTDGNGEPFTSISGTSTFNFNGGTLKGQAAPQGWLSLMYGLTRANVRNGGAVIDTNGNDRYINQALEHSDIEGDAAVDGGLTKNGAGQLQINPAFSYTGNTTVNAGTLSVQSASFDDASTVTIADGATLDLNTGGATDTVGSLVLGEAPPLPNGTYGAIGSTAQYPIAQITGSGFIQVGEAASGYSSWALANVNEETADLDYNNDGVGNGIAYFMNNTGIISLPGLVEGAVTWTNGGNIAADQYEIQFVVQTSPDLAIWTNVESDDPNLNNTAGTVTYTLPTGMGKLFSRLVVTPD